MTSRSSNIHRARWNTVIAVIAWLLTAGLLTLSAQAAPATQPAVAAVDHLTIVVSDADRAADFYTRVLSFEKERQRQLSEPALAELHDIAGAKGRAVRLRLKDESIELMQYLSPVGRSIPTTSQSNDGWFQHIAIITSDMDQAYARLEANHIRHVSATPQRLPDWNPKAGGIKAFYFLDPDGHVLEVLQFPPGKGEARWQRKDRLFLGIDHTAIVTFDTEKSIHFYRDVLGMSIAGTSENWGDEQEHLNNVAGAHLRITTLRAASGPGVELLEYLTPRNGQPYLKDAKVQDLFASQTVMRSPDVRATFGALAESHLTHVSSAIGQDHALVTRDPDGHFIELVQSSTLTQASKP